MINWFSKNMVSLILYNVVFIRQVKIKMHTVKPAQFKIEAYCERLRSSGMPSTK